MFSYKEKILNANMIFERSGYFYDLPQVIWSVAEMVDHLVTPEYPFS